MGELATAVQSIKGFRDGLVAKGSDALGVKELFDADKDGVLDYNQKKKKKKSPVDELMEQIDLGFNLPLPPIYGQEHEDNQGIPQ